MTDNGLVGNRTSKRLAGQVRNIANQLAQIATGFEASVDGPLLLAEQVGSGRYVIDVINDASMLNGHEARFAMTLVLGAWVKRELRRLNRQSGWLTRAVVTVDYALIPGGEYMDSHDGYWTSQAFVATLTASVTVVTLEGAAEASFENVQAVIGMLADPVRPIAARYHAIASDYTPFEIKRKVSRRPPR